MIEGKTRKNVMINAAAIVYLVPTIITINKCRPNPSVPNGGNFLKLYGAGNGFPSAAKSNEVVGI